MTPKTNALTVRHAHIVPSILANAGENAATKFLEFFAARIRNTNTREAYARACSQFLTWSEQHVDDLRLITPMHVAAYIEQHPGSPQTVKKRPTGRAMSRSEAYRMIRRRAIDAGVSAPVSCHSFRATGITVYLENKGTLETAQKIAAHESPRTTKLYDRTDDQLSLDEIEKISVRGKRL